MKKKNVTIAYCLVQGTFWCAMCAASTFAAVYLGALGYTNTELGRIIALGALLGFFLPTVISPIIDRSPKLNASMAAIFFQTFAIVIGLAIFAISRKGMLLNFLYILWLGIMLTTSPMMTQISQDYIHEGWNVNFGIARAFGSLAFVGMSSGLGKLMESIPKTTLPLFAVLMSFLMMAMVLTLYFSSGKKEFTKHLYTGIGDAAGNTTHGAADDATGGATVGEAAHGHVPADDAKSSGLGVFLRENRDFALLLVAIGLIFSASEFFGVYMINIVENVGGTSADMGNILAVTAALEIPSMLLWGKVGNWKHAELLLGLSLFCFTIRLLTFGLAKSLAPMYVAAIFQMLGYGVYTPAIVDYIRKNIPYKDSVKAQSLVVAMNTFGLVFASLVGGILVDAIGVRTTLFLLTGLSLAGSFLGLAAVLRHKNSQQGRC